MAWRHACLDVFLMFFLLLSVGHRGVIDNFCGFYVKSAVSTIIFDIDNFIVVFALASVGKFFPVRRNG
jgi:hypothetical protein